MVNVETIPQSDSDDQNTPQQTPRSEKEERLKLVERSLAHTVAQMQDLVKAVASMASSVRPTPPLRRETIDERLDQSTEAGIAYWDLAAEALENKYSGAPKQSHTFLTNIRLRSDRFGWNRFFTFLVNGSSKNLLKYYGCIPLETITNVHSERRRLALTNISYANDVAESKIIFYFIFNSLAANMQRKISTRIGDMGYDGPTLLSTVLSLTYVSSYEVAASLCKTMATLHLKKFKWNVKTMNQVIRETIAQLEAFGYVEIPRILQCQIFRGYKTATNKEFLTFIYMIQNDCEMGRILSNEDLMNRADAKYHWMVQRKRWKVSQTDVGCA